jgi:hypothetical protein
LLTMRSRLRIAYSRRSNTCGCRAISAPAHISGSCRSTPFSSTILRFARDRAKPRIILKPR